MRIPFSILFAVILSLDAFAAPVPNADAGGEFVRTHKLCSLQTLTNFHLQALEVRKAKVAAKRPVKAPVKKPVAKPVAKKPVAKKPAAKPVAKKPVVGSFFDITILCLIYAGQTRCKARGKETCS